MSSELQTQSEPLFFRALEAILRPAVRFCLRRSLKFQQAALVLKRVFVEIAQEEIRRTGAEVSVSRLSVTTGLQRVDISGILKDQAPRTGKSVISRIVGQWAGDPRFTKSDGKPRKLSCLGRDSEFSQLVASISRELNAYAVLFELERLNLIQRRDSEIELMSVLHVAKDADDGFRMLGADMDDLFQSVEINAFRLSDIPNLHLKSHYDNLAIEHLPEIRSWILDEGSKFILKVQQYLAAYDKDLNPRLTGLTGGGRVAVGVFSNASPIQGGGEKE